jgi:hypothetical protein
MSFAKLSGLPGSWPDPSSPERQVFANPKKDNSAQGEDNPNDHDVKTVRGRLNVDDAERCTAAAVKTLLTLISAEIRA